MTQRKNKKKESFAQPAAHGPKGSGIRKRVSAVMPNTFGGLTTCEEIAAGSLAALFGLFRVKTSDSSPKRKVSYPTGRHSPLKFPFDFSIADFTCV
ncbi:MAG TPA: hypothetical protein VN038_20675 [Dyadobacter sp.]|nr:hypothetical protein [Dyadobacter sp.]